MSLHVCCMCLCVSLRVVGVCACQHLLQLRVSFCHQDAHSTPMPADVTHGFILCYLSVSTRACRGTADTHSHTHRASNFSHFTVKKTLIINYFTVQRKVQEMSQGKLKTVTQVTHSFSPENSCNPEIFRVFITISLVITLWL